MMICFTYNTKRNLDTIRCNEGGNARCSLDENAKKLLDKKKKNIYLKKENNYCSKLQSVYNCKLQKQPPDLFYQNRCSWKFCKIHGKTPVPESFFNKATGLWHRYFSVNFAKFLSTPFLQNTSGRLLLKLVVLYN